MTLEPGLPVQRIAGGAELHLATVQASPAPPPSNSAVDTHPECTDEALSICGAVVAEESPLAASPPASESKFAPIQSLDRRPCVDGASIDAALAPIVGAKGRVLETATIPGGGRKKQQNARKSEKSEHPEPSCPRCENTGTFKKAQTSVPEFLWGTGREGRLRFKKTGPLS